MWQDYQWLNQPTEIDNQQQLKFTTNGDTDFWRNTYYGFNRMTGHALLTPIPAPAFSCRIEVKLYPQKTYDQAGILLYLNEDNWLKVSAEFIPDGKSHLGAVVTSFGYSDWSSRDIDNTVFDQPLIFELVCNQQDVELYFVDGETKEQLRIAHLHADGDWKVGPYACSPNLEGQGCDVEVLAFDYREV
ncbi:regulation of enolase protein 1 (concanavalin A-like superfamily) [Exiguobacterium sp. PvP048]|uniref:DUF1349 domain-containing protein n=1 Tax=unclassified Exiguobacterium TaxID=2644629 RepID=UPI003392FFA9